MLHGINHIRMIISIKNIHAIQTELLTMTYTNPLSACYLSYFLMDYTLKALNFWHSDLQRNYIIMPPSVARFFVTMT